MKILFVTDKFPPEPTTVGNIVLKMSTQLISLGNEAYVFTTVLDRKESKTFDKNIIKVCVPRFNNALRYWITFYNPFAVKRFKEALNKINPDIVHFHNIHQYLGFNLLGIAKKSGRPVFITAHDVMFFHYGKLIEFINPNDLSCPSTFNYKVFPWRQIRRFKKRYNPFRNTIIRHYLKYADRIFAVSNALKEALNQNGVQNVEVVYNGINVGEWQIDQKIVDDFKIKYNLQDKKAVLFGGRLSAFKGGEKIILAMQKVIQRVPSAVLLVLGQRHGYAEKMFELAKELGIESNIIFAGWLEGDDLKAAYWVSDIVVAPSICFDSLPTVILEAMACKKPAIGTCFGGAQEIILDNKTGYVVNPFNTEGIAEKIADLLEHEQRAKEFGEAGYERIRENFSLEKQAEETLRWYNL